MATFSLVGSDTIKINQRILADLPHGEVAKVTYETDLVTVKTGKTGNTIFAQNASGLSATMELKVIRGSADDAALNSILQNYKGNPTAFTLISAELVKRLGDGQGNVIADAYVLTGGVISKQVEVTSNVEGDVEQGVSAYTMKFAFAARAIA
jgi:hypothetical protein